MLTFRPEIVSLCQRSSTGRYHPFIWRHAPSPGEYQSDMSTTRFKSSAHHTAGFESLADAEAECRKLAQARGAILIEGVSIDDWADTEVPATVIHVAQAIFDRAGQAETRPGLEGQLSP